jgi:hypothetical protein
VTLKAGENRFQWRVEGGSIELDWIDVSPAVQTTARATGGSAAN